MGETTKIEWTSTNGVAGATFSGWWGCTKVQDEPLCTHCYAADWAYRFGVKWGPKADRRVASDSYWAKPVAWNAKAIKSGVRRKVFSASMSDVFEDRRDLDVHRERLFRLIEATPGLDWLLLTKRPQHIMSMVPEAWRQKFPDNVWIGTSIGTQRAFDERWLHLLKVPALVRFFSMEPLVEHVDITAALSSGLLHWVIAGAESGNKARPSHPNWFRWQVQACAKYGVPYFFKQWGEWAPVMDETKFLLGAGETDSNAHMFVNPDGSTGSVWIMDSDGNLSNWTTNYSEEHSCLMSRVGKKNAGALLDGREYKAWPE